jgi:hypothetical protein
MADVTKTIGTASRNYSTIAAWEADLGLTSTYTAGDNAFGELYDDGDFSGAVTILPGTEEAMGNITLRPATNEGHTGTAGTGVQYNTNSIDFDCSSSSNQANKVTTIEGIEFSGSHFDFNAGNASNHTYRAIRNLVHDDDIGTAINTGSQGVAIEIMNNIFYDITFSNGGNDAMFDFTGTTDNQSFLNNTFHNSTNDGGGETYGIRIASDNAIFTVRNNIGTDMFSAAPSTGPTPDAFSFMPKTSQSNATYDYNCSSDSSATDIDATNSLGSQSSSALFESTTGGSEDLQLKSGSNAIDQGVDLGTSPSRVQDDIDNYDRDAGGNTWDMGAHEFPESAGAFPDTILFRQKPQDVPGLLF